jgi:hypothetical protein
VTASALHEDDRMRTAPSLKDSHRFGVGPSFGLGVEEELLVVDPVTSRATAATAVTSGRRWSIGSVRPELADSMVELITPICARAPEARDADQRPAPPGRRGPRTILRAVRARRGG